METKENSQTAGIGSQVSGHCVTITTTAPTVGTPLTRPLTTDPVTMSRGNATTPSATTLCDPYLTRTLYLSLFGTIRPSFLTVTPRSGRGSATLE